MSLENWWKHNDFQSGDSTTTLHQSLSAGMQSARLSPDARPVSHGVTDSRRMEYSIEMTPNVHFWCWPTSSNTPWHSDGEFLNWKCRTINACYCTYELTPSQKTSFSEYNNQENFFYTMSISLNNSLGARTVRVWRNPNNTLKGGYSFAPRTIPTHLHSC